MSQKKAEGPASDFLKSVLAHHAATLEGNSRRANREAASFHRAAVALKSGGEAGIAVLSGFLSHPEPAVRCTAAAYLLKERAAEALATLEPLAKQRDIVGLGAVETLKRYRRGELEIR